MLFTLEELLLRGGALEQVGLKAQPIRELVFEDRIGLIVLAQFPLDLDVEVLAELLATTTSALTPVAGATLISS